MSGLVITSDWHLDAVTAGVSRTEDVSLAVCEIVKRAVDDHRDFVFLGDLCDPDGTHVHIATGTSVMLDIRLKQAGCSSVWVQGNHDFVDDELGSSTLSPVRMAGAHVADMPQPLLIGGLLCGILPYARKVKAYDPDDVVRTWHNQGVKLDLVLGHLNDDEQTPGSETHDMARGKAMHWPKKALAELYPKVPLIGGHYHAGGFTAGIHIVGAPARFTFGESSHKPSYLLVNDDCSIVRVLIEDARRVYSVGCMSAEERAENLAKAQPTDIVRVLYADGTEGAWEHLEELRPLVAAVRDKKTTNDAKAPEAVADRPDEGAPVTAEDGFAAAKRLAREWPTADEAFRVELGALVDQLAEQSR